MAVQPPPPRGRLAATSAGTALRVALRQLRRERALTQRDLCTHLHLASHTSIVDYESGRRIPPPDVVTAYERHFGLAPGTLHALRQRALAQAAAGEADRERADAVLEQAQDGARTGPGPRHLPAATSVFTGRAEHLADLDRLLADRDDEAAPVPPLALITGPAGVGKTALALTWAHRVRDRFPDGQVYLDVRAFSRAAPLPTEHALAGLLQALGVAPAGIPTDLASAAALYRSLLATRRTLILLDNVCEEEQIRALLPAAARCMVVATSRVPLAGIAALDGAWHLPLGALNPGESHALVSGLLRQGRSPRRQVAVPRLALACAHYPLALHIAAAHLTALSVEQIPGYLERLEGAGHLADLEAAADPPVAVRATFELSYQRLQPGTRRVLRLLGLAPVAHFDRFSAAALTGLEPAEALSHLQHLHRAQLLHHEHQDRYSFHDLLRDYAHALALEAEPAEARAQALGALYEFYLRNVDGAARRLYPQMLRLALPEAAATRPQAMPFAHDSAALAWLDEQLPNLIAAARSAAEHGPFAYAWLIPDALRGYLWRRRHGGSWLNAADTARAAADRHGDAAALAAAALLTADAYASRGKETEAEALYTAALEHAGRAGWLAARAAALGNLGGTHHRQARLDEAIGCYQRALAINEAVGSEGGQATVLNNLGSAYSELGRLEQAIACHSRALALHRRLGSPSGIAAALHNLGVTSHQLGDLETATASFEEALAHYHRVGEENGAVGAHTNLADVHRDAARYDEALTHASAALTLARKARDPLGQAGALCSIASIYHRQERYEQAHHHYQTVLDLAPDCGRHSEIEARIGRSLTNLALGRMQEATGDATESLGAARLAGVRMLEGKAHTALAAIHRAGGQADEAACHRERALALYTQLGYRVGMDELAEAWRGGGDAGAPTPGRDHAEETTATATANSPTGKVSPTPHSPAPAPPATSQPRARCT